jgi:hypothetical protein
MAGETVFADIQTVAAFLAADLGEALRAKLIMPNLCHIENFQVGSDSLKLRVKGTLAATAAAEATDHAISQYQQSTPATLTVAEKKVYVEISNKAEYFSGADIAEIMSEMVTACQEKLDIDALALLDGFSTNAGAYGADCSDVILAEAAYKLEANNAPGPYAYVLHTKQWWDVKEDLVAVSGAIYTNPTHVTLLSGQPAPNGLKGMFFEVPVYVTTNAESVNTNADWSGACMSVGHALAMGLGGSVRVEEDKDIKKGVRQLAASLWYDVKEYRDLCGVQIRSQKA